MHRQKMVDFPNFTFLMSSALLLLMFFISPLVCLAQERRSHSRCSPFSCGKLGSIEFPFNNVTNPECGMFTIDCSDGIPKIQLKEEGHWYQIESIFQSDAVVINDTAPAIELDFNSCQSIKTFSLPSFSPPLFSYRFTGSSVTLFNCSHSLGIPPPKDFQQTSCGDYDVYYHRQNLTFPFKKQCSTIQLPVPAPLDHHLTRFTFEANLKDECYRCHYKGGKCKNNPQNQFCSLNITRGRYTLC